MQDNYATAGQAARAERVIESLTDRVRKCDAGVVHAIGQASELRARLLGEREPAQINKAADGRVPTPVESDTGALRSAILSMEANLGMLNSHLENLERL